MNKRSYLLALLLIVATGIVSYLAFAFVFSNAAKAELVAVNKGSIDVSIVAEGELVAKNYYPIAASPAFRSKSDVIGQLRIKSMVPEGKQVRAGEAIAILDREIIVNAIKAVEAEVISLKEQALRAPSDTANQLRDIRYNLSTLRINMEISQINMEQSFYDPPAAQRKSKLEYEKSKIAYDQALQNYRQKKLQVEDNATSLLARAGIAAKKQLELQRLLGATVIRAPRSGVVTYYTDLSGAKRTAGSVISSEDLTVALIPDISTLYSTFNLAEDMLAKIKLQQNAKIRVSMLQDASFDGRIDEIAGFPQVVDGKKMYAVMVRVVNPSYQLRPMMSTVNDLRISTLDNVLYLPKKAVMAESGKHYVYTADNRKQEVTLGGANSENVAIVKGVEKGQQVYLNRPVKQNRFTLTKL